MTKPMGHGEAPPCKGSDCSHLYILGDSFFQNEKS